MAVCCLVSVIPGAFASEYEWGYLKDARDSWYTVPDEQGYYYPTWEQSSPSGTFSGPGAVVYMHVDYYNNVGQRLHIFGAKVELVKNGVSYAATSYTDQNGDCVIYNVPGGPGYAIRFTYENDEVRIGNQYGAVYVRETTSIFTVTEPIYVISGFMDQDPAAGMISEVMRCRQVMYDATGWARNKKITFKWPLNYDPGYMYLYNTLSGQIYVEYINIPDNRRWDKRTLWHEYAHAMMAGMYNYNANLMPHGNLPNEHFLTTVSNSGSAMNEGWAEFMEAVVENNANNCSIYDYSPEPNIENNAWWSGAAEGLGPNYYGENVEGGVASILWDLFDTSNSIDE